MVHAMKMGWMKPTEPKKDEADDDEPKFYMLWEKDDQVSTTLYLNDSNAFSRMKFQPLVLLWFNFVIYLHYTKLRYAWMSLRQRANCGNCEECSST